MKKRLAVLLTAAVAGVALTAAGCGSSSKNLASLSSNWYSDAAFKNIQPTFTGDNAENYTYKVTQSDGSGNGYYTVKYAEGTYNTQFYAKKITETELSAITLEKWRDEYAAALGSEGFMYLYYYKTELLLPSVTFTLGNESKTFENQSVVSESYFLSVADYLSPVYTLRTVHRTLPAELQATELSRCYTQSDMKYESFYNISGGNVTSYITDLSEDGAEPQTYEAGGLKGYHNSVFDYTYLDVVIRAMRGTSLALTLYTPGLAPRDYSVTVGNDALLQDADKADKQLAGVQSVLEAKGMFTPKSVENEDGTTSLSKLETKSATVTYNGGSFSGVSQKYWFATDAENTTRTLMVKYSEPLVYNLGALDYVLQA